MMWVIDGFWLREAARAVAPWSVMWLSEKLREDKKLPKEASWEAGGKWNVSRFDDSNISSRAKGKQRRTTIKETTRREKKKNMPKI